MIKTLARYIGNYKKASILTPCCMVLEVLMEVLIPFVTAAIIDKGIEAGDMKKIVLYGAAMIVMALLSLCFGVLGAKYGAEASTGFACNVREAMYANIQTFSFSNIDKFSTAGLVTRMTTDVSNVQMAFQMILRIAVRSPMTLVISIIMCFVINARLSCIFLGAAIFLGVALFFLIRLTMNLFKQVFEKYDDLNASGQESLIFLQ